MSIRVMNWLWEHSAASGSELLLLLAIADAADDHGRNAYPSINTLAAKTRMSRRSIQRLIGKLAEEGHLEVSKAGGRMSNSYAIIFNNVQELTRESTENSTPPSGSPTGNALDIPESTEESTPGDSLTQLQNDTGDKMTPLGCHSHVTPGVSQLCHPTLPIPKTSSTPAPTPTRETPVPKGQSEGGGGPVDHPTQDPHPSHRQAEAREVLESLGPDWRIGKRSAKLLKKPLSAALEAGWSAENLAEYLRANPEGVKSSYAVLASRLADLPDPPQKPREWPAWCGECDATIRMRENEAGEPYRCPTCHPSVAQRDPSLEKASSGRSTRRAGETSLRALRSQYGPRHPDRAAG